MKSDIHPTLHPVVFVDSSCGAEFVTTSTLTSDKKKKIKGVDHYVVSIEISSASHPFYTGKQMLIDTAGRVDKFRARMEASKKMQEEHDDTKKKKDVEKKESVEEKITRKAKVNTEKKAEEKIKKAEAKRTNARKARAKKEEAKEEEK